MVWTETRVADFFEGMFDGFAYCQLLMDEQGNLRDVRLLQINRAFKQLTGWDAAENQSIRQIISDPAQMNPDLIALVQRVATTGKSERVELYAPMLHRWLSTAVYRPEPGFLIILLTDVTERKHLEDALRKNQELFSQFMRHSPIYMFIKDAAPTESRVIQASDNYIEMIGIAGRDMVGKTMHELFPPDLAAKFTADDWAVVSRGEPLKLDEELNGRYYTTLKFPIVQGNKTLLAGYSIDVTEHKQAENQLRYLSMRDALTDVFNRAFFEAELARLAASGEYPVSIIIADVDNLKKTNDDLGHIAGDALIRNAAQVLERAARPGDLVARIGGDEFAIIMPATDQATNERQLERIRAELNTQPTEPRVQLSLGGATAPTGSLTEMFKLADARMYEDKSAHKQMTDQARYLSTHDTLTGIFNRAFFEAELGRFEPSREFPVSLVVLTLDNLRVVNLERTHTAGDALLKRATRVMRMAFRASDIIARISGNEFAVILPKTDAAAVESAVARVKDLVVQFNTELPELFLQIALGAATSTSGKLNPVFQAARAAAREQA